MREFIAEDRERNIFRRLEIRPGTEDDIEAMALVTERTNADRAGQPLPESIPEESEDYSDLQERIHYDGYWSHLAFDRERLAGFVCGYPGTWKGEDSGGNSDYLWLLMVDPEYQRQGLGKKLLEIAADDATARLAESLTLYVSTQNKKAAALYETVGFRAIESVTSDRQGELIKYTLDLL